MSDDEKAQAFAALVSMCSQHQPGSLVSFDQDCGDCGSRQEAAGLYLVSLVDDVIKALNL